MRHLVVGDCTADAEFAQLDPDAALEKDFQVFVAEALRCAYPAYTCVAFRGDFAYDDLVFQPDLALVARDLSHWFVVEVELVTHSLDGHVLPQIRAFQYGRPLAACYASLARELGMDLQQARTLVDLVPRGVAVITNRPEPRWEAAFRGLTVQLLTVSVFRSPKGQKALEIEGRLEVTRESLGFGTYSATDRSVRFGPGTRLPEGVVQVAEPSGSVGLWVATHAPTGVWLSKEAGVPTIRPDAIVHLIRTYGGQLSMRVPS